MKCPKCGEENVIVTMAETGSKTQKTGIGLGGHINNIARANAAVLSLGMTNLVWKKSVGEEKTVCKNEKFAICQDCGHSWKVK